MELSRPETLTSLTTDEAMIKTSIRQKHGAEWVEEIYDFRERARKALDPKNLRAHYRRGEPIYTGGYFPLTSAIPTTETALELTGNLSENGQNQRLRMDDSIFKFKASFPRVDVELAPAHYDSNLFSAIFNPKGEKIQKEVDAETIEMLLTKISKPNLDAYMTRYVKATKERKLRLLELELGEETAITLPSVSDLFNEHGWKYVQNDGKLRNFFVDDDDLEKIINNKALSFRRRHEVGEVIVADEAGEAIVINIEDNKLTADLYWSEPRAHRFLAKKKNV